LDQAAREGGRERAWLQENEVSTRELGGWEKLGKAGREREREIERERASELKTEDRGVKELFFPFCFSSTDLFFVLSLLFSLASRRCELLALAKPSRSWTPVTRTY
jgi:hypothetical protein